MSKNGNNRKLLTTNKRTIKQHGSGINYNLSLEWFKIAEWLQFAKLFWFTGFLIFIVSLISGSKDRGILVSYFWITIGTAIALFMTTLLISMNKEAKGFFQIIKMSIPLIVPALFLLIPLIMLIYTFTVAAVLDSRSIPSIFYIVNGLSFVFIIIQTMLLNRFYSDEIKSLHENIPNSKKWLYISGLIFFSIFTSYAAYELYIIITSYPTDG